MSDTLQLGFDREGEITRRLHELLTARDLKPWPLTDEQRRLLRVLEWHKGESRSMVPAAIQHGAIAVICEECGVRAEIPREEGVKCPS